MHRIDLRVGRLHAAPPPVIGPLVLLGLGAPEPDHGDDVGLVGTQDVAEAGVARVGALLVGAARHTLLAGRRTASDLEALVPELERFAAEAGDAGLQERAAEVRERVSRALTADVVDAFVG